MYALIKTGGKQYKVSEGDVLLVEKLEGSSGGKVEFDQLVMISDEGKLVVDSSSLSKAKVFGTIVEQAKGNKIIVFKYKPKKGYHRKTGHRQQLTKVKIEEIALEGMRKKETKKAAVEVKPEAEKPVQKKKPAAKPVKAETEAKPKEAEVKSKVKVEAKEKAKVKVEVEKKATPKTETKTKTEKAPVVKKGETRKAELKKPAAKKTPPKK